MIDLFKNPFAVLEVTVQDAPRTIRDAAARAVAEGRLSDAEADAAAQTLLDPDARLAAEVSWLLGRSAPRVRKILDTLRTRPDTPGRLALLETIDGLARANLAAHLCAVERGGVSIVRAMVEAQNEIEPPTVFWLVNGNREVAGFPPVPEMALLEALALLQARHCAAVCEAISAREEHRKFMVRLFADGWDPKGAAYSFLERVVATYDAWYAAHLDAIARQLDAHLSTLMAEPGSLKATEGVKKCLALWDEYSTPLQHPAIDSRAVEARARKIHAQVSAVCAALAREHWRFRVALQLAESLSYAFPDFPPQAIGLPERMEALPRMGLDAPGRGVAQEFARTLAALNSDPRALAAALESDGFRTGRGSPAARLYDAFAEAMAASHASPLGEGLWIMLRCLALDLAARHGEIAGACALMDGMLAQEEAMLLPSEIRRLLEEDVARLRHAANRRTLDAAIARGKLREANDLVEALLLNPPAEAAHEELLRARADIQHAMAHRSPRYWLWLLLTAGAVSALGLAAVALN